MPTHRTPPPTIAAGSGANVAGRSTVRQAAATGRFESTESNLRTPTAIRPQDSPASYRENPSTDRGRPTIFVPGGDWRATTETSPELHRVNTAEVLSAENVYDNPPENVQPLTTPLQPSTVPEEGFSASLLRILNKMEKNQDTLAQTQRVMIENQGKLEDRIGRIESRTSQRSQSAAVAQLEAEVERTGSRLSHVGLHSEPDPPRPTANTTQQRLPSQDVRNLPPQQSTSRAQDDSANTRRIPAHNRSQRFNHPDEDN